MVPVPLFPRCAGIGFAAFAICAAVLFGSASLGKAQIQDNGSLEHIIHPDRTLHYSPADKEFTASSSVTGRQATVKPFAFNHDANIRVDSAFTTRTVTPRDKFRTQEFSTRGAQTKDFTQKDKAFGTKAMDVKEDRAANKAMPVGGYALGEKPYLGRGKRQDTIDDLHKNKDLTIEEVRELLNKPK